MPANYYNDFKLTYPKDYILPLKPIFSFAGMGQYVKLPKARNISTLVADKELWAYFSNNELHKISCALSLPVPSLKMDAGTRVWLGVVLSFS